MYVGMCRDVYVKKIHNFGYCRKKRDRAIIGYVIFCLIDGNYFSDPSLANFIELGTTPEIIDLLINFAIVSDTCGPICFISIKLILSSVQLFLDFKYFIILEISFGSVEAINIDLSFLF